MDVDRLLTTSLVLIYMIGIGVSGSLIYPETTNTSLGHSRDQHGNIVWADPPTGNYHGNINNYASGAWSATISFAKSIVLSSTLSQAFPYDLIRRIIRGEYQQEEVSDYESNIVISCSVGGVLIFCILAAFTTYFTYVRCHRRKNKYSADKPVLSGRKLNIFIIFGVVTATINFIFIITVMTVNSKINTGSDELENRVTNSMEDVVSYFNQTQQQYEFMTLDSNLWFGRQVLQQDINNLANLIWQSGSATFYPRVRDIFKQMNGIDTNVKNAASTLTELSKQIKEVTNGIGFVTKTNLQSGFYNLSLTRNDWTCFGCDGSCLGCLDIIPDDVFPWADFFTLPNLAETATNLTSVSNEPIIRSPLSPEVYYIEGIRQIIHNSLYSNITALLLKVDKFIETVNNSTSNLVFPNETSFYFDELKPNLSQFNTRLQTGNNLRSGFTWLFTVLNIIVVVIVVVVLVFVLSRQFEYCQTLLVLQQHPFSLPRKILIGCGIGCILLSVSYLGLAIGGFYIGANLERVVCQTSKDYSIVEKTIDVPETVPDHPGYFVGSVVLGNGTYPLQLAPVLRACEDNRPGYEVLQYHLPTPNFKIDLNISQQFGDVSSILDSMYIDLVNTSLVPPELHSWFHLVTTVTTIDTTPFLDLFNKTIIKANLDSYIANLRHIANTPRSNGGPMNPSKSRLIEIADTLTVIKAQVTQLATIKDYIKKLYYSYQSDVTEIKAKVGNTIDDLMNLDAEFWKQSKDLIKQGVDEFRSDFIKTLPEFTDKSMEWLNTKIGMCGPLTDAYQSIVYGFCDKLADFESAEWLLCSLTSVTLISLSVIIIIIYNSLVVDSTYQDHINANFEKMFANKEVEKEKPEGEEDRLLNRIKKSVIKTTTRTRRGSTVIPLTVLTLQDLDQQQKQPQQYGSSTQL